MWFFKLMTKIKNKNYSKSIFVNGLYALQCVSIDPLMPDVTLYRRSLDSLINGKSSVMSKMVKSGKFDLFVLAHASDRRDFFDKDGVAIRDKDRIPKTVPTRMSDVTCTQEAERLEAEVSWLVKNPTVCASFEAHVKQSAVGRSNFYAMLDYLLLEDVEDEDRESVYVLSSHVPFPRSCVLIDMLSASEKMQDAYLDNFKSLSTEFPLSSAYHKAELARTLAVARYGELRKIIRQIMLRMQPQDSESRIDLVLMSVPLKVRLTLAEALLSEVYDDVVLEDTEVIPQEAIEAKWYRIGEKIDYLLGHPIS